jgi:hypothetical protein
MKHNTDKIRLNQMPKSNEEIEQVVAKMMLQIKIPYTAIKTKRDRFQEGCTEISQRSTNKNMNCNSEAATILERGTTSER